jgi:uncharacterized protein (TIGR03067 family)
MRRETVLLGESALVITLLPTPASAGGAESGLRPADLVGLYTIVRGEEEGVPEPDERVKGSMVRFSEDRVVVVDKENKEIYGAEYKLDPRHSPAQITMTSKLGAGEGQVARGLIEKKGDTVRLVYSLPVGDAPTSFKTKTMQLMFEMTFQKR